MVRLDYDFSRNEALNISKLVYNSDNLPDDILEKDLNKVIFVDYRQKEGKHELKHNFLKNNNYELITQNLISADYATENSTNVIDTKKLVEIPLNLGKDKNRFTSAIQRANDNGFTFWLVIELDDNDPKLSNVNDFRNKWLNGECVGDKKTRKPCPFLLGQICNPLDRWTKCQKHNNGYKPIDGDTIANNLFDLEQKFNFKTKFCHVSETGQVIQNLLFDLETN